MSEQFSIEHWILDSIGFALLYFALWLVQKTRAILSTNPMQT